MKKTVLLLIVGLILTFGCQPAPTPIPVSTPAPPTATANPPTSISVPPTPIAMLVSPSPASAKPGNQVLLIAQEKSAGNMEVALTKEVGVMKSMLEKAGFKVVVASVSGQSITGGAATLKPDLKLADVKVEDYAGFILPCMGGDTILPQAVEIVTKAATLGKPIAAQLGSVMTLAKAGVLDGKQFTILPAYQKYVPNGIYKGIGVVQDGNVVTGGVCPLMAGPANPDTTAELTDKLIALLASAR